MTRTWRARGDVARFRCHVSLSTPVLLAAFLLFGIAAPLWAQVSQREHGQLLEETVHSAALEGNLAGNNADRSVFVYLPPRYDRETERRYPTIYLLSGIGDPNTVWTEPWNDNNPGYATIPELMDAGVSEARFQEMIVVIPDARTAFPGSFYTNSPVMGNWEDFIVKDLVDYVDSHFRTVPRAEARGIGGHSMGGHGAIKIAMRHPDVFQVVYAMNPAVLGWGQDVSEDNPAFRTVLGLESPEQAPEDPYVFAIIGLGQAWSPDPAKPPFLADFPFDLRQGVLTRTAAYDAWMAEMPLYLVGKYAENLKKLRGLRFDSAFVDEYAHIPATSKAFSDTLMAHGVRHRFEMYNGDHRNRLWGRMGRLYWDFLPWFSRLLER